MTTIKFGEKEYNIKFAYEPTLKSRILSKIASLEDELKNGINSADKAEDIMLLIPEIILIGLQKFHRNDFGYDYDSESGKQEQLSKVFDLVDDYFDCNEDASALDLYDKLQEEMLANSFLSKIFQKEKGILEEQSKEA